MFNSMLYSQVTIKQNLMQFLPQNLARLAIFLHDLQLKLSVDVNDRALLNVVKSILAKLQALGINVLPSPMVMWFF